MATYRLLAPWVPGGPGGGTVLPTGTLIGDGTGYPVPKDEGGREQPPAASEKADPPKPVPGTATSVDPGPAVVDPSKPYVPDEGKKLGLKATAPAADEEGKKPSKPDSGKAGDK